MPLATKDCISAICEYCKHHHHELPKDQSALHLGYLSDPKRVGQFSDGERPKDWKRFGKKKVGNKIIRAFHHNSTNFLFSLWLVVIEEDGKVTEILPETYQSIDEKYGIKVYG